MKVNVYSERGILLKEFGDDPGESSRDGVRRVQKCIRLDDNRYRLEFDDGLFPERGYIHGSVIVIAY